VLALFGLGLVVERFLEPCLRARRLGKDSLLLLLLLLLGRLDVFAQNLPAEAAQVFDIRVLVMMRTTVAMAARLLRERRLEGEIGVDQVLDVIPLVI